MSYRTPLSSDLGPDSQALPAFCQRHVLALFVEHFDLEIVLPFTNHDPPGLIRSVRGANAPDLKIARSERTVGRVRSHRLQGLTLNYDRSQSLLPVEVW